LAGKQAPGITSTRRPTRTTSDSAARIGARFSLRE
jgi:hypothetical protein